MQGNSSRPTSNDRLESALSALTDSFRANNPESARRLEQACNVMPGGNTRTVLFYPPFPLTMSRGKDSLLWDVDGHEYINLLGEYTAGIYGHSHPVIREAIDAALDQGMNLGAHNLFEAQLARAIVDRFPSIELVRFTNSGTEANLMALGLAKAFTGRTHVLAVRGGYHGAVLTLAMPDSPLNVPLSYILVDYNDVSAATRTIEEHAGVIAAIILEPMLGSGGCIPASPEFLAALREQASKIGAVLIFDEVMTSRLTSGGLQQKYGIHPDLTTLGKYIGGGSSFGAFGGRADIMSLFDPRKRHALLHAGTFNNNIITMAAGYAGLTKVYTPQRADALNARGEDVRQKLNQVCRRAGATMQFTGIGSLMNAHFSSEPLRKYADIYRGDARLRDLYFHHLLSDGIYTARRNFVALSLAVTDAQLDRFVESTECFCSRYGDLLRSE